VLSVINTLTAGLATSTTQFVQLFQTINYERTVNVLLLYYHSEMYV